MSLKKYGETHNLKAFSMVTLQHFQSMTSLFNSNANFELFSIIIVHYRIENENWVAMITSWKIR